DDVLFEHRLPDGTRNHLRMASDGSLFLQRNVKRPEDNSDFAAGIRIDPQGLIEIKSGKVVLTIDPGKVVLTIDPANGKVTIEGDVEIKKTLTVDGDGKISGITISGTEISGG